MTESIERAMELHAPPERVWRAITDAGELSRWFGQEADIEMRPGAKGWFGWETEGRFHCIVDVVEPPTRLVWRWGGPPDTLVTDDNSTTVEWTLTRRADGGTTLRLVESGFHLDEDRAENDQGWTDELRDLFAYLDSEAAGRDDGGGGDGLAETSQIDGPPMAPATP